MSPEGCAGWLLHQRESGWWKRRLVWVRKGGQAVTQDPAALKGCLQLEIHLRQQQVRCRGLMCSLVCAACVCPSLCSTGRGSPARPQEGQNCNGPSSLCSDTPHGEVSGRGKYLGRESSSFWIICDERLPISWNKTKNNDCDYVVSSRKAGAHFWQERQQITGPVCSGVVRSLPILLHWKHKTKQGFSKKHLSSLGQRKACSKPTKPPCAPGTCWVITQQSPMEAVCCSPSKISPRAVINTWGLL